MTEYKPIAESNNFIILEKYIREWKVAESYQSEGDLERELIVDLQNQGYEFRPDLNSQETLLANARAQLQTLNNVQFSDDPIGVDDDRLADAKLTDRSSDGIDSVIVDAGIVRVGTNAIEIPNFDFHRRAFPGEKRNGKGSVDVCLFGCLDWFCWIARWVDCLGFKIPTHKTNSL
jgi:hypothetical protein